MDLFFIFLLKITTYYKKTILSLSYIFYNVNWKHGSCPKYVCIWQRKPPRTILKAKSSDHGLTKMLMGCGSGTPGDSAFLLASTITMTTSITCNHQLIDTSLGFNILIMFFTENITKDFCSRKITALKGLDPGQSHAKSPGY